MPKRQANRMVRRQTEVRPSHIHLVEDEFTYVGKGKFSRISRIRHGEKGDDDLSLETIFQSMIFAYTVCQLGVVWCEDFNLHNNRSTCPP